MTRPKHPNKDIEKALKIAEGQGCRMSIWSTPKSTTNHARHIERYLLKCPHIGDNNNDDL